MQLVGYDNTNENDKKNWLLKNSFGSDWGENGFIRLEKGARSTC